MKKAIHCTQEVKLFDLNIFHIGANREYINKGLMEHELTNDFSKYLKELETLDVDGLAIQGELLDRCAEHAPELLIQFHKLAINKKLIAVPYYGSHVDSLSADEFNEQLELQQKAYKEHFDKVAKVYLGKVPINLKNILVSQKLKVVNPEIISSKNELQKSSSDMQTHILKELSALYPHIIETNDKELISDWRMLAHSSIINSIHEDSLKNPYDNYVAVLHICNDIAHRIKNFKLSQKGEFLSEPKIVSSPSALLSR